MTHERTVASFDARLDAPDDPLEVAKRAELEAIAFTQKFSDDAADEDLLYAKLGYYVEPEVPEPPMNLRERLGCSDIDVRSRALQELAALDSVELPHYVPELLQLIQHPQREARDLAVGALSRMPDAARSKLAPVSPPTRGSRLQMRTGLLPLFEKPPSNDVRESVLQALGSLPTATLAEQPSVVLTLLINRNETCREAARAALRLFEYETVEDNVQGLLARLMHKSPEVARATLPMPSLVPS